MVQQILSACRQLDKRHWGRNFFIFCVLSVLSFVVVSYIYMFKPHAVTVFVRNDKTVGVQGAIRKNFKSVIIKETFLTSNLSQNMKQTVENRLAFQPNQTRMIWRRNYQTTTKSLPTQTQAQHINRGRNESVSNHTSVIIPTQEQVLQTVLLKNLGKPGGSAMDIFMAAKPGLLRNVRIDSSVRLTRLNKINPLEPVFKLHDDTTSHWMVKGDTICLKEGTSEIEENHSEIMCHCNDKWQGLHCSIPLAVKAAPAFLSFRDKITIRKVPRRVIMACPFNIEFDQLSMRVNDLYSVVDVFVLLESNYTSFGQQKPMLLAEVLQKGFLKKFQNKILYMFKPYFLQEGLIHGTLADIDMHNFIGIHLFNNQLQGFRDDDIFIYFDADEIPSLESILFLKLHNGYPEPFGFSLHWTVYGYFWTPMESTNVMAGCSVSMFSEVFEYKGHLLRDFGNNLLDPLLQKYIEKGNYVQHWYIGDLYNPAGWHCSWCLQAEGIAIKLIAAQNGDFPRWGNFPEKVQLPYIRHLINTGSWFNGQTNFFVANKETDQYYAPPYALKNPKKFKACLDKAYGIV